MDKVPTFLDRRVFKLIFKIGEVSKLKKEERMAYEASLKSKWDTQNAFDYGMKVAAKEAAEKERAKAEQEKHDMLLTSARALKKAGVANVTISNSLNLPLELVEQL